MHIEFIYLTKESNIIIIAYVLEEYKVYMYAPNELF